MASQDEEAEGLTTGGSVVRGAVVPPLPCTGAARSRSGNPARGLRTAPETTTSDREPIHAAGTREPSHPVGAPEGNAVVGRQARAGARSAGRPPGGTGVSGPGRSPGVHGPPAQSDFAASGMLPWQASEPGDEVPGSRRGPPDPGAPRSNSGASGPGGDGGSAYRQGEGDGGSGALYDTDEGTPGLSRLQSGVVGLASHGGDGRGEAQPPDAGHAEHALVPVEQRGGLHAEAGSGLSPSEDAVQASGSRNQKRGVITVRVCRGHSQLGS